MQDKATINKYREMIVQNVKVQLRSNATQMRENDECEDEDLEMLAEDFKNWHCPFKLIRKAHYKEEVDQEDF